MKITLSTQVSSKTRRHKTQERFDKLSAKLKKQRQINQRFRQELDELIEFHRQHSLAAEQAQLGNHKALADKLLVFVSRKSLALWQRDELIQWFFEVVRKISPFEPDTAARLEDAYASATAKAWGMTRQEMEELMGAGSEFDDPLFDEADAEDDELDGFFDDFFGFDPKDPDQEPFSSQDDYASKTGADNTEASSSPRHALDSEGWIKQLFRKAAQALHPDREPDEAKRELKQRQMRELLKARKQGDIMTLLGIYTEHVDSSELQLAEQEMSRLCDLLQDQIDELEEEKDSYIFSHPHRLSVFQLLYAPTSKKRQQRIEEWKQSLADEAQYNKSILNRLRTLKDLKPILEDRNRLHQFQQMQIAEMIREFSQGF
jgi:hypothetical protein